MKKIYILVLLLPFLLTPVLAQKKNKDPKNKVSITPIFAMPIGKLGSNYKNSLAFQAGFFHTFSRKKSKIAPTIGAMLNFTKLKAKGDTLHFPVDDGFGGTFIGTSYYSAFSMIQVKLSGGVRFTIMKDLYLTPGAELGYTIGKRDRYINDGFNESDDSEIVGWLLLSPKVNVEYKINKHFSIEPHVALSFIVQAGSTDTESTSYNENTGLHYSYLSPGISLNFLF